MENNLKKYKANAIPEFHVSGRGPKLDGLKTIPLFWAGSSLDLYVKTTEVWADIESDYSSSEVWLCVWVNGRKISRFMAPKGKSSVCLCRNLNPSKENLISLMRDTQPMSGDVLQVLKINAVSVTEGTEFLPVPQKPLKIEFIGDSITSGEGMVGGPEEWDWISQWICVSENYAVKTAMTVNAEFNILSQCGWGVITGWDNNIYCKMPEHYENVCSLQTGENQVALGSKEKWDFTNFQPDFIFVNLGTNDSGAFNQPAWKDPATGKEYKMRLDESGLPNEDDGQKLAFAVADFLKVIREKNQKAKICWIWGMIDVDAVQRYLEAGVYIYKKDTGDTNVDTMLLPSMSLERTDFDKGSRGHPGPLTHRLASEKLIDYIKNNANM